MKPATPYYLTREQFRVLKARFDRIKHTVRWAARYESKLVEPASVTKARATVKAFEERVEKAAERALAKADARLKTVEDKLYFGNGQEALRAIDALEKEVANG